ncbi:amino acid ABC transporter permease [Lutispora sp.]|uniref:amino acid ABC transporter permease n=1 Tax=Lutispora sp. TaxID=2828727 RepID=UPI000EEF4700|nr:amino acid ABC transporter permease [Lutispora sp.]MEA4960529.1 amino acid ABC transporter permease [Lutispora sp.]HCJ56498.1 arginine ABC transporter permease [Clostridiaceae bacterium]
MSFLFLNKYAWYYINGAKNTILLTCIALFFGIILGLMFALLRLSDNKALKYVAVTYIEIIRGTPILIQIMILYFGVTQYISFPEIPALSKLIGYDSSDFMAGAAAVAINSGAYVAEIIRAGIQSISKGQMEAARSLGLTKSMAMRYVIVPQAFKNILPALGNEFVTLIKETSVVSVIGIMELTKAGDIVRGATAKGFEPLIVAAVIYFSITFTASKLVGLLERRMRVSD